MSTQYDRIGVEYNRTKELPGGRLERANFRAAVAPYIQGAKVLDLACGSGFYSRLLLEWGAASVVGVDISPQMIKVANGSLTETQRKHILFQVGNCCEPVKHWGGPFDVVVGAWLLNYASTLKDMTRMYVNISQNLKPGGMFVAICPPPTNDPEDFTKILETNQNGKYHCAANKIDRVNHGVSTHVKLFTEPVPVEFDTYHLQQEVYEKCARDGGMKGPLEWIPITIPEMSDLPDGYWDGYLEAPYFGILSIKR